MQKYAKILINIHSNIFSEEHLLKERDARLKEIRKLIKNNKIESQEELLSLLTKDGFEVTQATLSRDLKLLKVGKIAICTVPQYQDGENGGFHV